MIIPYLESAGGNCQEALILVEELAVTVKLLGGFEGAEFRKEDYKEFIDLIPFYQYVMQYI